MKAMLIALVIVYLFFSQSHALSETITFDAIDATSGPVAITNQFQLQGVIFQDVIVTNETTTPFFSTGPGAANYSSPNAANINDEVPFSLIVSAIFQDPNSGLASTTDSVQAIFFDTEIGTRLVKMTAFDIFGNVLDVVDVTTPSQQFATVGISMAGIHRITMETDTDGNLFDNFNFGPVVPNPNPEPVPLDIKPQSCPNPLNVKMKGDFPVAILGTVDFDVLNVDPASVRLEGVAPLRSALEDVATPFIGVIDDALDCNDFGPDGFDDLTLKFDTQEVISAIETELGRDVEDGETLILSLDAELLDSTPIFGEDVVVILKKGK